MHASGHLHRHTHTHTHMCVCFNHKSRHKDSSTQLPFSVNNLQLLRGYKCRTHGKVQECNLSRKTNVPEEKSGCPENFRENFLKEVVPMLKAKEFNTVWRRGRWPAQSWGRDTGQQHGRCDKG